MPATKKISHYFSDCIGCGACASICPQCFKMNQDTYKAELIEGQLQSAVETGSRAGQARTTKDVVAAEMADDLAEMLVNTCPAQIIEIISQE